MLIESLGILEGIANYKESKFPEILLHKLNIGMVPF